MSDKAVQAARNYGVHAVGQRFSCPDFRVMCVVARNFERHGIAVSYCDVRRGAAVLRLRRDAWLGGDRA